MPEPADLAATPSDAADAGSDEGEKRAEPAAASARRARRSQELTQLVRDNARAVAVVLLLGLGITIVLLGWYGAAHTNIVSEQIPYLISGGLLGLGLIIVAGILAASAWQEHDAERLRSEIAAALTAVRASQPLTVDPSAAATASTNGHNVFVLPGGRSYHEPGCPIVEGKENVEELVTARALSAGYAACKLCGPDV